MAQFLLIDPNGQVLNVVEAATIRDAIEWFFFNRDYVITSITATEATVVSDEKKFTIRSGSSH